MIRVAINGYGRIGRLSHRVLLERFADKAEVVAINGGSSTDVTGWMYLLKYDTAYGPLTTHQISAKPAGENKKEIGFLTVDGNDIPVFSEKDPANLPWKDLNVDVVIESTGHLKTKDKVGAHLTAGAKAVVLSVPAKDPSAGSGQAISTYVRSVNDANYKGEDIISNASCTTNCITPVAKVIEDSFGIEKAMMTTVHAYTSDQKLQDGGHKDYRRARAAAQNIIPTSTGATSAAAKALPSLKGKFGGLAIRVPVISGSLSDLTFLLKAPATVEDINNEFIKASKNPLYKGILAVTEEPLVSSDILGSTYSTIVDLSLTQVVGGNLLKVIAWYDNEYGYTNRLVEEVLLVGNHESH